MTTKSISIKDAGRNPAAAYRKQANLSRENLRPVADSRLLEL